MNLPRRAVVLLACLFAARILAAQSPLPFANDERNARVAERYQAMLAANPSEGMALDRLWKMYEERNATALLIDSYRRATDTSEKPADALVYGHLLKRAGRLDEAAGSYERAARLDPASPLPLVAQADLASARSQSGEAAALIEKALGKMPAADRRRADLLLKLGAAWLAAEQPLKASEAWEKIVDGDPGNFALRKQLAANYEKNGLPERAIAHYEYIDQHGDPASRTGALRELGRLREARGECDAARDALERGLALTARDNWLHGELQNSLIRLYQRAGKVSELEARWKAAVEQAPRDLGGYLRLIALAEAQGDPAAARLWLEKFVALVPRDRDQTLKLARLLADQGDNKRAAALFDGLLKLQPGNLDLILARAELDLQMNKPAEAVARVEGRIAQNPADESLAVPALQFFLSHRLDDAARKLLSTTATRQPAAIEPALALAKFDFGHGRADDARKTLDGLTRQTGDPAARAQRWTAAADCFKDAGRLDEALRCWREVLTIQPESGAALVVVGELLLAKGDLLEGTAQMERAVAVAPDGSAREEIDHRLFQALLDHSAPEDIAPSAPVHMRGLVTGPSGKPFAVIAPPRSSLPRSSDEPAAKPTDRPLVRYLAEMEKAVREKPTVAAYLRVARWLQWAHRPLDANVAAESVLALEPGSIPAREILADNAAVLRNRGAAIKRLSEIAVLNPSRKPAVTKRIADLLLEDGQFDGALTLLDRRAQDEPGSVEVLTDLALALQRADRWFDALASWERAYALPRLTPAQRTNLRQPLIAAHEHLGQYERAAVLFQTAIDGQDELAARQDLFRELAAFCRTHALTPWLEGIYKKRFDAQPKDYFTMTALAELQKSAGDARTAYRLLDRAYYSAPDPLAALRNLVVEAEKLGEDNEAIAHQRRLVGLPGQANAENLGKLAALEETNPDDKAAAQVWTQIETKFSRDTNALGAAADYFARTNRIGRARELLQRIVALDASDFRHTYQLAQLDGRAGDAAGARACLETILAHSRPEDPDDLLVLPREIDPATEPEELMAAATRSAARAPAGTPDPLVGPTAPDGGERDVRLKAIGQLSRMLFAEGSSASSEDRTRWLDRWRAAAAAGARSEPLTAFFHAEQKDLAVELTASWLHAPEDEQPEQASRIFVLTALRMENYPPLAQWVWSDEGQSGGVRSVLLAEVLQYFLSTGGRPTAQMAGQLFPAGIKSRQLLWQMASEVFADKRWYAEAVELGERAVALPGGNIAADAFQLAQWELAVGRLDAVRDVLRRAVEEGDGTAFDNAVFASLRAYYFLLPASERSAFAKEYLRSTKARGSNPVHATLAAALLHGLEGDEAAASSDLDRIVQMRLLDARQGGEFTDLRRWNYLLACGGQLQAWNLDRLAAHIWRRGLADASAFDKRDPAVRNVLDEIRLHQLVAEVITADDPQETHVRVEEYLRERPPVIIMSSAASVLASAGQHTAAIQIYERLRREAPSEADHVRSLLQAYEASDDRVSVQTMLKAIDDGTMPASEPRNQREAIAKFAGLTEYFGDADGACRLLLEARQKSPRSLAVLRSLAQTLERRKRPDDAAAIWKEAIRYDPGITSLEALASLEIARGHGEDAFRLAREVENPSVSEQAGWFARRVAILLAAGHPQDAVNLGWEWVRAGRTEGLLQAASNLADQGQRSAARDLLTAAVQAARDPTVRFQTQRTLVHLGYSQREVPLEGFLKEMRRLEQFARAAPGQRQQYESDRYFFAVARGATEWLESELKREWDDGQGEIAAGDRLADLYIETKQWDALRRLVAAVDARPNLPEQTLASLESRLIKVGRGTWALPISERLCRRFPQNADYAVMRARALWQAGQREDAVRVLEVLDAMGVFHNDFSGRAALMYAEMGDRVRMTSSLEREVALDPHAARSGVLHCRLAESYLKEGRLNDAYRLLYTVYSHPSQTDMGPLVDYLEAAGKLKAIVGDEMPGGELPLTFLRRAQLLEAVYDRMIRSGDGIPAFELAVRHPELFPAVPALVEAMTRNAIPAQVPVLAASLEVAIHQAESPADFLRGKLARIDVRQAELAAANQPSQPDAALNFLTQAYELEPEDFAVARPLAAEFRSRHLDARASAVLAPFLRADALPTERAAARQLLGLE